jgi:hypothetical protein
MDKKKKKKKKKMGKKFTKTPKVKLADRKALAL